MTIPNSNIIDGSTINTHTPSSIFLRNQKYRNSTRTKAFTYIPTVQKVLDLSLNFLSLLRIGSIGCMVGQGCSWNQIDLMLYPSHRWQPRGYLSWKMSSYSCKRLVTAGDTELTISSSKNIAHLHTKA